MSECGRLLFNVWVIELMLLCPGLHMSLEASIVSMAKSLAPHHLIDTDSGGGANNLHIGDVNDIHSCTYAQTTLFRAGPGTGWSPGPH